MSNREVKELLTWVAVVACVIAGVIWFGVANDLEMFRYFAPKYEAVRRDTFEQSKAYRQGMVQELQNMQFEYIKASDTQKDSLASIILHRAADVDPNILSEDLKGFISELKRKQNGQSKY